MPVSTTEQRPLSAVEAELAIAAVEREAAWKAYEEALRTIEQLRGSIAELNHLRARERPMLEAFNRVSSLVSAAATVNGAGAQAAMGKVRETVRAARDRQSQIDQQRREQRTKRR